MGEEETPDTLKLGEPHPSAGAALAYIREIPYLELVKYEGALASTSLSGNRLAQVCCGTLSRLQNQEPVSDRYLLGLAWALRDLRDKK